MFGSTVRESVNRWEERNVGSVIVTSDLGTAAGPIGFTQLALHDLADGAARQRIAELHGDQPLRLAELAVGPFANLVLARRRARLAHAKRHRRFAPLLARNADHGDVDHVGMPE